MQHAKTISCISCLFVVVKTNVVVKINLVFVFSEINCHFQSIQKSFFLQENNLYGIRGAIPFIYPCFDRLPEEWQKFFTAE